jgi:hypothetical protein
MTEGSNRTDRGKMGTKRHILADKKGIPLPAVISPASTHDIKLVTNVADGTQSLKGRHHHLNPKQEEGRGGECNTCVLTRHTILNMRNRNYSNEGMYCIFHRKEEKVKKRRRVWRPRLQYSIS